MEERCQQFHTDAVAPKARSKEIDKLRKFIFKNQGNRFTEREQSHLFQAVQVHVTACAPSPGAAASQQQDEHEDNPAVGLLEDALKMPFNVFTTSHKKAYLKWLDKLQGSTAGRSTAPDTIVGSSEGTKWTVIDVLDNRRACLMTDEGEEMEVGLGQGDVADAIKAAFEAGEDVKVVLDESKSAIVCVLTLVGESLCAHAAQQHKMF